ncbi:MazG nucleotide pyrophosphohydrolase domain-containing protein [Gordonia phosphorivorans]|uniref:MazG nucleotide pyrophosphohydrolase domain-containing protein n=1 Tax=Gordonia phosphorivorans TaxID=1056982 RepID=A0ABV6HD66_9ACTN
MPVILLDPALPELIPVRAVRAMTGHVYVTEDVHPSLLWNLPSYEFASGVRNLPLDAVVLTADRRHPIVRQQLSRGAEVIAGDGVAGMRLLEAVALMDKLRRTGPWEQRQTHDSLRRYLLEEVYELLDAFDQGDTKELCSELGDLLLQVLFHARIAEDAAEGAFDIDDVAQSFVDKVSYRTPGVLSGEHADLERQIQEWEERKDAERNRGSVLDGVVTGQPVLSLTQKLFERLAGADFPRDAVSPSLTRIDVPIRKHARDSVEDSQRRLVLQLMNQVRAAERAAAVDGIHPRDENTWRKYLGMVHDDVPPVEPAPPSEAGDTQESAPEWPEPEAPVEPVPMAQLVESPLPPATPVDPPRHAAPPRPVAPAWPVEPVWPDDDDHEHNNPWAADALSGNATAGPGSTADIAHDFDFELDVEARDTTSDPAETTLPIRPVAAVPALPTADAFDFPAPVWGQRPTPVPETDTDAGFPEPEDFPGPPPKHRYVDADPIEATERDVDVSYSVDVPRMVVRNEWDDDE